jgi:hypothetical protein
MDDPVATCFRIAEIEHDGIVARGSNKAPIGSQGSNRQLAKNPHSAHHARIGSSLGVGLQPGNRAVS